MMLKFTSQTWFGDDSYVSSCLCVESWCWVGWYKLELISKITFSIVTKLCQMMYTGYLLTYLRPSLPVEHRPSTTPRHRTLFLAALVIPDQLVPCCFSSASVSRLQLLRGRPLFLFPCGPQVRAWCVMLDAGFLRVCPIQPHFLRSICLATGSCPARSHRSSFRIFSCHRILYMRLRQVLKNVWIFRCIVCVVRHVSHTRHKAGLISHWSWRCRVWFSCWFLQMPRCFSAWQKLLLPCRFWLCRLSLCLPDGQPHFPGRRRTPPPLWALHQLWLGRWQLCSSLCTQGESCLLWSLFGGWQENKHTVKVGTRSTCTHAVGTRQPTECCEPAHNVLRREPMGVASVFTCFEKVKN